MITTKVCLPRFEKILIAESGAHQSSNWANVLTDIIGRRDMIRHDCMLIFISNAFFQVSLSAA